MLVVFLGEKFSGATEGAPTTITEGASVPILYRGGDLCGRLATRGLPSITLLLIHNVVEGLTCEVATQVLLKD